jgi:hypothetical protein
MNKKPALTSKTLWVNYLVLFGAIVNELTPVLQDQNMTRTAMIMAIANIILRHMTNTGIGKPN